ncbi:hypothetical protein GCM10007858_16290 [Bradyrhizobium liaoningense]|nr:hypothetical protein GCM10007858_16290 [Bradyrhizobium liaoningense]
MASLSGVDIRSLAEKLTDAFNADEIASLVYEATGDRLYDEFVPDNLPLRPMIEKLLDVLQKKGMLQLFLAVAHRETAKYRTDVAAEIARLCPEVASEAPKSDTAIVVQKRGRLRRADRRGRLRLASNAMSVRTSPNWTCMSGYLGWRPSNGRYVVSRFPETLRGPAFSLDRTRC